MNDGLYYLLTFLGAYLIGSIPFGFLIGKLNGIDIRKHGSGNIGATNVLRTLGKQWGIPCFTMDFVKGLAPVLIVKLILIPNEIIPAEYASLATIFAALGTVFGHIYTIFLKFKGGKGIATSAGCLLALAPLPLLFAGVIWAALFFTLRYVSVASIAAAFSLPISAIVCNKFNFTETPYSSELVILLAVLGGLAIYRHKSNIVKLINGTENRFEKKKKA